MTVCIAAICGDRKYCVVGADREITMQNLSLKFEHAPKIDILSPSCVVMTAGDSHYGAEIVEKARGLIKSKGNSSVLAMAESLRDVYIGCHVQQVENVILRPRGWTLAEFKELGGQRIPLQVYTQIDNMIFAFGLPGMEFLVAGVDNSGAHIYRVFYAGVAGGDWLEYCDKFGFRAIGSGGTHATILLALDEQGVELPAAVSIFNAYAAKKSAEVAPGVGRATDLAVISKDRIDFLSTAALAKMDGIIKAKTEARRVRTEELTGVYDDSSSAS